MKPFQREALESLRRHPHTLLIAPTGSGKSLVFQRHVLERLPRTLLISPLNALARQQAEGFRALGVPTALGVGRKSEGPPSGPGVWILNPEKVRHRYHARIRDWRPELLIVDEAHCVFEWGERFRPEFARVPGWVAEFRIPKTFWCTATLTPGGRTRLRSALPSPPNELGEFSLSASLTLEVERSPPWERLDRLRELLSLWPGESGMIFVNTRQASERVRAYLSAWGYDSIFYHAGMALEERLHLEARLTRSNSGGGPLWVVATSAFGMGMDYAFLSRCVLFEPGFSLLSTAQALGRVGRAGKSAHARILWHEEDFHRHRWLRSLSEPSARSFQEVLDWCRGGAGHRERLEGFFRSR